MRLPYWSVREPGAAHQVGHPLPCGPLAHSIAHSLTRSLTHVRCPADHVLRMHYLAGVMPQTPKLPIRKSVSKHVSDLVKHDAADAPKLPTRTRVGAPTQ